MKKSFAFILLLFFVSQFSYSTTLSNVLVLDNDSVYEQFDVASEFEGGIEGLMKFVQENITYPEEAKAKEETARLFVEFVVDKSGQVRDPQFKRKDKKYFEREVLRVISKMPNWKPGLKNGEKVNGKVVLPITFKL
jgi:protein TonB